MVLDLFSGAAIGAVAGELLKALLEAREKAANFRSYFNRLEITLNAVITHVNEIQRLNDELDRPRSEISRLVSQLDDGKNLVRKCSGVPRWDYFKRFRYAKKILKLDEEMLRFFNIDLKVAEARDVKEILKEVLAASRKLDRLNERGTAGGGGAIEGWCAAAPELPSLMVGLDEPLKGVKAQLLSDGVSVLVLSGQGGSGKSTLASKLCREQDIKGIFKDNILFAPVSSTPEWKAIVQRLFGQLGNHQSSQFQNDESAINSLANFLRHGNQRPLLLVLDDVWEDSGYILLHKLSEAPLPNSCKILITSRFTFPTLGSTYIMNLLNAQDSMALFRHLAFPENETLDMPDDDLVETIVSCCKGLPLAIVVVAGSLRRQPAVVWRTTARKWQSNDQSIYDSDSYLLDRLATSLEVLDDLVKECFFDLGLFLEDQKIPSSVLIDIWAEMHEIDDDDAYVILLELYTRNLASLIVSTGKDVTKVDGCYNELFVTQHDFLRELAIYKSNQRNIEQSRRISIRGNKFSKYRDHSRPFGAQLLSISADDMSSSGLSDLQLHEVEFLILNFLTRTDALPRSIETMSKLKVLSITNHALNPGELRNFPRLHSIADSLRRIRLENISIPPLDKITVEMKSLRKVSLIMCRVGQAFCNCPVEIAKAMPNIVEIEIDYCNDLEELPIGVCDLISLEKLSVTNCHNLESLPAEIGRTTNLQVLRLSSCTGLSELPESIVGLGELRFLDISDCMSLSGLPEQIGQLHGLRKLNMRGCKGIELPTTVGDLKELKEVICDNETVDQWNDLRGHLSKLKIKVPVENANLNWRQI